VGTLALMRGGSAISKDLPPYTVVRGENTLCGLNTIGLRRAGLAPKERLELKQLYHALFREGLNLKSAVASAQKKFVAAPSKRMIEFVMASKRGVCFDGRDGRDRDQED
jgi:UDP-N-acetylglucosamine acyltransferase